LQENYPQIYEDIKAYVQEYFYGNKQAHMWFSEDGKLLRVEMDYVHVCDYMPYQETNEYVEA